MIDFDSPFGARVRERLERERLIWLVTVRSDGLPQPSVVWFWWDGADFLIYSRPGTQKLRNIERGPKVALHLDGDGMGGGVAVFSGEARADTNMAPAHAVPEYVARYGDLMQRNGWSPEEFSGLYSVAIRVRPTKLTGH